MFDATIRKLIIMFGILVFVILGCSNMLNRVPVRPTMRMVEVPKIVYQSIHDTLYRVKPATVDELKLRNRIEHLLDKSETAFGDIGEIKKLNIDIQKQNVILFTRAFQKRVENDSLKEMVKSVRDTLNYANRKANQFYSKAQQAALLQQENNSVNQNINWQFWAAFSIVILLIGGNLVLTGRLNEHNKKRNNVYV